MDITKIGLISVLLLAIRIYQWIRRLMILKREMPVVPVLFPSISKVRLLFPERWQTYHRDWHMRLGRRFYKSRGSDIVALVSLFEYDQIFVSDPAAFVEIKVTRFDRYQKDIVQARKGFPSCSRLITRSLSMVTVS